MLSWKSDANLKIVGAEGYSPEALRAEIDRGAKFVLFSYNFSIVVMSFKRPSNVYLVMPGHSRVMKGLPFTLISLLFGWWGIPWGVIYTIQSLHTNLTGGVDVTADILASLAPRPPTLAAASATPPPLRPARVPASPRRILATAGVLSAVAAVAYVGICFFAGQNLPVALVSGLATPYSIELNGQPQRLTPRQPVMLKLAQGEFVVHGAPGSKEDLHYSVSTPFFSRPFEPQVLVINPDQAAVLYREIIQYHPTGATPDPNEEAVYSVSANRAFHLLAKPDYFFEDLPEKISMPTGQSVTRKSRIAAFDSANLASLHPILLEKLGVEGLREYLTIRARLNPDEETLQRVIFSQLSHDDARRLFESHLADRPVSVEWHRAYQFLMDSYFPTVDLTVHYRRLMEAEPENGTLIYLYARSLQNPAESHPLYEKALVAKRPSAYASYALGVDEFAAGHFDESLRLLRQAESAGLHNDSLRLRLRDSLLALGRVDEVLAGVRQQRAHDKTDAALFVDELQLSQSIHSDSNAAHQAIAGFVSGMKARYGASENYEPLNSYLTSRLAYSLGSESNFAVFAAHLTGSNNQFEAAVSARDLAKATKALAAEKDLPPRYSWLLMLTAHAVGNQDAVEQYYASAVAALGRGDRYSREIVRNLATNTAASHAAVLRTLDYADDLRILFTALGVKYPEHRALYFARARELDHDPAFPHLLLEAMRKVGPSAPKERPATSS